MSRSISDTRSGDPEAEIRRSERRYLWVGLILFCGTAATVAVATIPALDVGAHGFDKWDALLGLAIAATKATLVATIFMHLNHERALIYWVILAGVIHACGFFIGTWMHYADPNHDPFFYGPDEMKTPSPLAGPQTVPNSKP